MEIFRFSGSQCDWTATGEKTSKNTLGGKGAALVKMAQAGMPVPPGFTITTDVCNKLAKAADQPTVYEGMIATLMVGVSSHMKWLEKQFGYMPLVSVRSGAPVSMPGMMDTILNVGLTSSNLGEWVKRLGYRSAMDSQRRLIQMLGATAYGVPSEVFEFQLAKVKKAAGVKQDTDLDGHQLAQVVDAYTEAFEANAGFAFPTDDAHEQLRAAIKAVFDSWMNPRAIEYRKLNKIDESIGTAVNVQAMVFGNMGDDSGTGVLFTRNPSTGEDKIMGEFLQNAQGEDVVAGIRTPRPLHEMAALPGMWSTVSCELMNLCTKLEVMYQDMVDVEFTVQQGKLYLLQSRTGKRSARAAFKIATDLVAEGVIDRKTALSRLTKEQFKVVRRPGLDPSFKAKPTWTGLPACPGVVSGKPVFSSQEAVDCKEPCILITHETTPDDIKGMAAAVGILTQTGGATSHAAVVARAMDKTCITGCTELSMEAIKTGGYTKVTIDGSTGNVWLQIDVPVIDSSDAPEVRQVMDWCMAELDAVEGFAVDQDHVEATHGVHAAQWWGNVDVAEAVLDSIAERKSPQMGVILDIRAPDSLTPNTDRGLLGCFGNAPQPFDLTLVKLLKARKSVLGGLVLLVGKGVSVPLLEEAGYITTDDARIVPADFAAFSVLQD